MNFPSSPVDLMNFAPTTKADVQVFTSLSSGSINWQSWVKPRGVTMSYMMAIGGGGGGGAGFTRTAGSPGGGGGGGACSGIARLIVPSFLIPDTLYINVGAGGLGITGAGTAGGGGISYISYGHSIVLPNVLLASGGTTAAGGGVSGTGAAVGTAGTQPTIPVLSTGNIIGQWAGTQGIGGGAGGAVAGGAGTTITTWATLPLSPGAGGAGAQTTDSPGGGMTATVATDLNFINFPITAGAVVAGGVAAGGNGGSGVSLWQPFYQTGGAGGGSFNAGVGGAGGNGGYGCGGGGGGAGTTGGRGGNGGNGLVVIISW